MPTFVTCPSCQCAAKSSEHACPHCGVTFNRATHVRTAAAIVLGLATVAAGCGDSTGSGGGNAGGESAGGESAGGDGSGGEPAAFYGVAGAPGTGGTSEGGSAGEGGFAADYGVPGTGGGGGAP